MKTPGCFFKTAVLLLFLEFGLNFSVFAQWSQPVNLSPNAVSALLNESMGPCIGVSGTTIHVVWADRFTSKKGAIYYTASADTGLTWSTPVAITNINGNAWNPAIAVNGSNIHVVWREIDTITQHRSSHYKHSVDGGSSWGANVLLDTAIADWPAVTVSGNLVYVANDIVTSASPYNTEIFFLKSSDNGTTWSTHQQLTFATGRSEDEAITARGSQVHMAWNDNRSGRMQIFYKRSTDYGASWGPDVVVIPPYDYGTMVSANGANIDIPCAGAVTGHYQILMAQSSDSGVNWGTQTNVTNDTAHTFYYPYMVRDSNDMHMTFVKSGVGGQYLHSGDGGTTWDSQYNMGFSNITPFIAYTGCVLHVIIPDSGHINYIRNPTGNSGAHCTTTTGVSPLPKRELAVRQFPNPFNMQTMFEISSSENPGNFVLEVYDVFGRKIITSLFGKDKTIIIGRDKLLSGVYFYRVIQNEMLIGSGKMLAE